MLTHVDTAALDAAMADVAASPSDGGLVEMIVARPALDERLILEQGVFTREEGLVGDDWRRRGSRRSEDGGAHPQEQITLINRRFLGIIAGERDRWVWAGDQLVVDLDLGEDNLPVGDRFRIGSVLFEVSPLPHTGCAKFAERFGSEALRYVSSPEGRRRRLRGMYASIVESGSITVGDTTRCLGRDTR